MSFLALARSEPRAIVFGFLCTLASSPGQTFLIALFLPGIKSSFGLGDAQVSNLYALATVLSAGVLWKIGRWIDRMDLLRYAFASGLFLTLACLVMATADALPVLAFGLFCLRLGGQGLLTHVVQTATGRYFTAARGKALSMTSLGFSVGEVVLPGLAVMLIGLWGWRPAFAAAGGFVIVLVAFAAGVVHRNAGFRTPHEPPPEKPPGGRSPGKASHRSPDSKYFLLTLPLFVATPLVVTALVFHQAVIAQAKGMPLQWFAVAYTAFALSRVASGLLVGPAIDRFGSRRLFALHLLPLCLAIVALVAAQEAWALPVYWMLAGVTAGMASALQVAILAERFPPHRLGTVRSVFASITIVASALGPALYGGLLASGLAVSAVLLSTLAAMVAVTALAACADHNARRQELKGTAQ